MTRTGGSARRSQSARFAGSAPSSRGAMACSISVAAAVEGASPMPTAPSVDSTSTMVFESPGKVPTLQR